MNELHYNRLTLFISKTTRFLYPADYSDLLLFLSSLY